MKELNEERQKEEEQLTNLRYEIEELEEVRQLQSEQEEKYREQKEEIEKERQEADEKLKEAEEIGKFRGVLEALRVFKSDKEVENLSPLRSI